MCAIFLKVCLEILDLAYYLAHAKPCSRSRSPKVNRSRVNRIRPPQAEFHLSSLPLARHRGKSEGLRQTAVALPPPGGGVRSSSRRWCEDSPLRASFACTHGARPAFPTQLFRFQCLFPRHHFQFRPKGDSGGPVLLGSPAAAEGDRRKMWVENQGKCGKFHFSSGSG